jgi:uncharacterized protein (TIGR00730 family)
MTTTTVAVYASWQSVQMQDIEMARKMGRLLAAAGYRMVFGGGTAGPMGAAGQAAKRAGAHVTSVTQPDWVEPADHDYDELLTRPRLPLRMDEIECRADAFVVLPGGLGTAAELFSAWADAGNGSHTKPIILVAPSDDPVYLLMDYAYRRAEDGYVSEEALRLVTTVDTPEDAIEWLAIELDQAATTAKQ